MHERNTQVTDGGLFANKGTAAPTRDFVPRLKTDEPAQIEPETQLVESVPEAKPLPHADGALGGLIRRRTEPQPTDSHVEPARSADMQSAETEAREITRSASEHIDNGMLYESLKLGLPLPKLGKALTNSSASDDESKSFEEAALERLARPTTREPGTVTASAREDTVAAEDKQHKKSGSGGGRRQLTARLSLQDFERFKAYAEISGRTYQDILSSAASFYLDKFANESMPSGPTETPDTIDASPDDESDATKSIQSWLGVE